MSDSEFVRQAMEKQGIHLAQERAEAMTGPGGLFGLLLAIRSELFNRDVHAYIPNADLYFGGEG